MTAPETRPILVGEMPGPNTRPDAAMFPHPPGSAGGRLCAMLGLRPHQYVRRFDRANLLYEYGRWDARAARAAAQAIRQLAEQRAVLLLGRRVAEAFGMADREAFAVELFLRPVRHVVVVLPHPSGRNRVWNDPTAVDRLRAAVRAAAPHVLEADG